MTSREGGFFAATYTHAIMRHLPSTFAEHALRMDASQQVDAACASQQLQAYTEALERCGVRVVTLPADDQYPDCVFVEDTAVVLGQRACLTRPGHPSRRGEVAAMKQALEALGVPLTELDDPEARLDGGDVIFTGQEILVGQSKRSNHAAVESLRRAFPEYPVTPVPVEGTLHLKNVATLAEEGVLVISSSPLGQKVMECIQSTAHGRYRFLQVDNDVSTNVICINGCVIMKSEQEIGAKDYKSLAQGLSVPVIAVQFDEFYKADGCLTCCCLLLTVPSGSCSPVIA